MAVEIRIQDMIVVSGTKVQDRRDASDVGGHRHWSIQVRTPRQPVTSGTMYFQHAARNEEEAYVDIPNISVNLVTQPNEVVVITDPLRFLRWRVVNVNADAGFLIDAIGRN